jgi:hypothetical protein
VAEARAQGDRGQTKLNGINESALHACGNNLGHIPELVHGVIKVGVQDGFYDINIGSPIFAGKEIMDEL